MVVKTTRGHVSTSVGTWGRIWYLEKDHDKSHKRIVPSNWAPLINNSREFPFRRRNRANFRCFWTDESRDLLNSSRILCQKKWESDFRKILIDT
jgi:hypothetical protein